MTGVFVGPRRPVETFYQPIGKDELEGKRHGKNVEIVETLSQSL
jgi:hypothetical protein